MKKKDNKIMSHSGLSDIQRKELESFPWNDVYTILVNELWAAEHQRHVFVSHAHALFCGFVGYDILSNTEVKYRLEFHPEYWFDDLSTPFIIKTNCDFDCGPYFDCVHAKLAKIIKEKITIKWFNFIQDSPSLKYMI